MQSRETLNVEYRKATWTHSPDEASAGQIWCRRVPEEKRRIDVLCEVPMGLFETRWQNSNFDSDLLFNDHASSGLLLSWRR